MWITTLQTGTGEVVLMVHASMGASTSSVARCTMIQGCTPTPRIRTTRRRQHRTRSPGARVILLLYIHQKTDMITPIMVLTMDPAMTTSTNRTATRHLYYDARFALRLRQCQCQCLRSSMATLSAPAMTTAMTMDTAILTPLAITLIITHNNRHCHHLTWMSWQQDTLPRSLHHGGALLPLAHRAYGSLGLTLLRWMRGAAAHARHVRPSCSSLHQLVLSSSSR